VNDEGAIAEIGTNTWESRGKVVAVGSFEGVRCYVPVLS